MTERVREFGRIKRPPEASMESAFRDTITPVRNAVEKAFEFLRTSRPVRMAVIALLATIGFKVGANGLEALNTNPNLRVKANNSINLSLSELPPEFLDDPEQSSPDSSTETSPPSEPPEGIPEQSSPNPSTRPSFPPSPEGPPMSDEEIFAAEEAEFQAQMILHQLMEKERRTNPN